MSAKVGSRFLTLSDAGLFLDSDSLLRIQALAAGKVAPMAVVRQPIEPVPGGKYYAKSIATYAKRLETVAAMHTEVAAEHAEFHDATFVIATTQIGKIKADRVMFSVLFRGEECLTDIITGCIYSKEGRCFSTDQIRIIGTKRCTLAQRKKAIAVTRKGGSGEY
jgi:hypothetical protein